MGSIRRYYPLCAIHLSVGSVLSLKMAADRRCINARRIKRGGGPVRYTGWTVPSYNQSQQQYGYTNNQGYDMNNYPQQGPYQQTSYQGQPQYNSAPYGNETAADNRPAYYDASASQNPGITLFGQILTWKMFINLLLIPLQQ
jgi:hypothetical protein